MLEIILNIFLIILKILGILLLSALLLIVTLLLIVLFVPIRYKSSGDFNKTENGIEHHIYAKITWCLRIISINCQRVDNKNKISFKVFGYDLLNRKKKTKKKVVSRNSKSKMSNTDANTLVNNVNNKISGENTIQPEKIINKNIQNTTLDAKENIEAIETEEIKTLKKKKTIKEKIETFFNKIKEKISEIVNKIKAIAEKIKNIRLWELIMATRMPSTMK